MHSHGLNYLRTVVKKRNAVSIVLVREEAKRRQEVLLSQRPAYMKGKERESREKRKRRETRKPGEKEDRERERE